LNEAAAGAAVEVCRRHGISETTFYRWKAKFGGLAVSDARRVRQLEAENTTPKLRPRQRGVVHVVAWARRRSERRRGVRTIIASERAELVRELLRRLVAERTVWPLAVVVLPPGLVTCAASASEPNQGQAQCAAPPAEERPDRRK
jgi:hypothetical protein